jgi:hypothetical protein
MAGTSQATGRPTPKHVHHGRTPAAWVGSIATSIAFVLGAIALIVGNWVLFWISVVVVVVGVVATVVLQKIGYGAH